MWDFLRLVVLALSDCWVRVRPGSAQHGLSESLSSRPLAIVYRGPSACDGCPEAVGKLLRKSKFKFRVVYAGPNEKTKVTAETLKHASVYAQPGGDDEHDAWAELESTGKAVQDFVAGGGRYMGFCLGAYLAGPVPGFSLLPPGARIAAERLRPGAEVTDMSDDNIRVDWRFSTGPSAGTIQKQRWLYFQDGSAVTGLDPASPMVLATYSSNGDVAATLTPYGKGWVGTVGPHPEADKSWYEDSEKENPEGIRFDIGYDFIEATMAGGRVHDGEI